jgi:carbon storage regulator
VGEQIVIAGNIVVTVVAIEGGKIRLGVEAPRTVRVDRAEVHQRRMAELADEALHNGHHSNVAFASS